MQDLKQAIQDVMQRFTTVTWVDSFQDSPTPARVNRNTGDLYLSLAKWPEYRDEHKLFILLHERSHILLNSSDEEAVDNLAFLMYSAMGFSLKEAVRSLSSVLSGKSQGHYWRVYNQLQRAIEYDCSHYGNKQACQTLKNQSMCGQNKNCAGCSGLTDGPAILSEMQDYEGFEDYSGCQPGEKPRHCRKRIRVESRAAARENRSEGARLKGQARAALADKGISDKAIERGTIMNAIKGTGGAIAGILGRNKGDGGDSAGGGADGAGNKKKNTWVPWVVGGGIGLVVIGVLVVVLAKKK